jgi:hypothetical protein
MPPAIFEPTIPTRERPQTDALHRAATGIVLYNTHVSIYFLSKYFFIVYDVLIVIPWKSFHYFLVNFDLKFALIVRLVCFFDISVWALLFS